MARVSITDAAARLNVSVDSIRRRIRRGDLTATRDNRGQWWLDLADDVSPEPPHLSVEERLAPLGVAPAQQEPMQPAPDLALTDALRAHVAELSGRLEQAERERDQARQEREDARVRAAGAEGEVRALREALEEARRPAWRRWFGA